jgi:uncharacterized protein
MARLKSAAPATEAIVALVDGKGRLAVRATPNAAANAILLPLAGAPPILNVRVTAAPEDGRANAAVLTLLADALDRPRSALTLLRGANGRDKLVQIALD